MIIYVGSKNPVKVGAVQETICDYPLLCDAVLHSFDSSSGVSKQPQSFEETVVGAKNRARSIFSHCDYSFGIESGLLTVPISKRLMDVCVCAIYDGKKCAYGISSGFELPTAIEKLVIEENMDLNEATFEIGLTKNNTVGFSEGLIGILTCNRVTRKNYTKQAIQMALIQLEFPEWYT